MDGDGPTTPGAHRRQDTPVVGSYLATFLKPEMLHIHRQLTALKRYQPVVLTRKIENSDRFPFGRIVQIPRPRTAEFRRFWYRRILRQPVRIYPGEATRIARELARMNARLLHVYFGNMGVHLLPLLRKRALPAVLSFHGADAGVGTGNRAYRHQLRKAFDAVDLVLARSQSLADDLAALGCPSVRIRLHRTGLPLDAFPAVLRDPIMPGMPVRILQACRLIEKKGLETTLRAFAEFARHHPHSTLTFAGEGPLQPSLSALASDLGLPHRVCFTGFLAQEELLALLQQAHLFVHPSQTGNDGDREGVPNSLLEAMATGLPPIATRHGGIPEAITSGESGLLVAERAADDLAAAMDRLASDPDLYTTISAGAASAVREKFDLTKQSRRLELLYDEAVATFAEPRRTQAL